MMININLLLNKSINKIIINNYLLFIIYYLLFIIYYLLFIIYYLLFIIYYSYINLKIKKKRLTDLNLFLNCKFILHY